MYICIISDEYVLILCVFPVLGTKSGPHHQEEVRVAIIERLIS